MKFLLSMLILLTLSSSANAEKVFLYFGASWCGPCKTFKQTLHQPDVVKLLTQYDNYYVDTDTNPELKAQFSVRNIPTVIIVEEKIENGVKTDVVLYRAVNPGKMELKRALTQHLDKKTAPSRPLLKIFEKPVKFFKKTLDN